MTSRDASNTTLETERAPAGAPRASLLSPVVWAAITSLGVMLLAIAYSGTLTEDFSDLTTGTMAFTGIGDKSVEIVGAITAVAAGAIAGYVAARSRKWTLAAAAEATTAEVLTAPRPLVVVLTSLLGLSSVALAERTLLSAWGVDVGLWPWAGAMLSLALAAVAVGRLSRETPHDVSALIAAQSLLGAGAFALLPAAAAPLGLTASATWTTGVAWFAAAACTGLVFTVGLRTARRLGRGAAPTSTSIMNGPGIVVSSVALSSTVTVPFISPDGYHFGELVSPSYLASVWDQMPFLDQFPARGLLVNFVPSWISDVVAAPGAGLVTLGHSWLTLGLVAVAYKLASRSLPVSGTVLVTATTAFAASNLIAIGDVVMVLALVLLYGVSKWRPTVTWAAAAILGTVLILAAPAQGSAWCLAAAILATLREVADRRSRDVAGWGAGLLVLVAAMAWAPLRRSVVAAIGYVASQGSVNDQVWGTPWVWVLGVQASMPGASPALEPIRAAILPILAVTGFLLLVQMSRHRFRAVALPVSLAVLIYLALQLPRALGRIDPDGISRVGALTLVAAGIALPLVAARANWFRWTRTATLTVALLVAPLIMLDGGLAKVVTFASRTTSSADAPSGAEFGVTGGPFGGAMISHGLRSEYASLGAQLHQMTGAEDGLLDLTDNQADFRYLQVANALSYGAAYNITSRPVETSELQRLDSRVPKVALLTSNLAKWHDGGSVGLRTPRIYRWVLDHYVPVQCGVPGETGFAVWGTSDGTAPEGCIRAETTKQRIEMFERAMSPPPDLGALARSWGSPRAQAVDAVLLDRVPARLSIDRLGNGVDILVESPSPRDLHDVLTIRLQCGGWTKAKVLWYDPKNPTLESTSVELGGGHAVLPMGAFPSFALRDAPLEVHIRIQGTQGCDADGQASWARYAPRL